VHVSRTVISYAASLARSKRPVAHFNLLRRSGQEQGSVPLDREGPRERAVEVSRIESGKNI
jgi:hypothetical protein